MKYKVTVYHETHIDYIVEASDEDDAQHLANCEYDVDDDVEVEESELYFAVEKLEY